MKQLKLSGFKPQLLPNDEAGVIVDWHKRIENPSDWFMSLKEDGVRVLILNTGLVIGRSFAPIASQHIQELGLRFVKKYDFDGIIEAEFYMHGATRPEMIHFSRAKRVDEPAYRKKFQKMWDKTEGKTWMEDGKPKGWKFPGRSVEWVSTWHEELGFHIFDCYPYQHPLYTKEQRYNLLEGYIIETCQWRVILQARPETVEEILEYYADAKKYKHEGLALFKRDSLYKFGRFTELENLGWKMKETALEWDAEILSVAEGTVAREGAEKNINLLGRSKTSQLKEDRVQGGYAKGFNVRLDDGRKFIVSLNGYSQQDKVNLWNARQHFVGEWIIITGMAPVKVGGMPSHAHYTRGNSRDAK